MENNIFTSNKINELLSLLAGYRTEKHTFEDKGYDFLDVGQCFITVRNPEEANNLSIKTGKEFTLFFGGWHKEYAADEEGFNEMIQVAQSILNCSQGVYILNSMNTSRYTIGPILSHKELKEKFIKNILHTNPEFKGLKLKNARLRLVAWQTEYNKEVCF